MDELKEPIFDWLMELEEEKAASFLTDCTLDKIYIDTSFAMDSDIETHIYEVVVSVPLKIHRKIDEYAKETSAIESAITESGEADGIYVRDIRWRPYLKNEHKKQADKKAELITEILTQEYVNTQIRLMNDSIESSPHLALGISKELIETCCKYILNEEGVKINNDWDVARLVKETNKRIDLIPF